MGAARAAARVDANGLTGADDAWMAVQADSLLEVDAWPALVELRVQANGAGALIGLSGPVEAWSGDVCAV
eukprot:15471652-Alexandrium_andersonii.AAC.1